MTDSELDAYIDSAAKALELSIDPAWKAGVHANLALTLRLAAVVAAFELPDDAEPAPVFRA